jgi:hypothetical protein
VEVYIKKRARTWTDDVQAVEIGLCDDSAEVGVYDDEARACAPVTEKARLDVGMRQFTLEQGIVFEKYHG